jgi:cysteine synthase A
MSDLRDHHERPAVRVTSSGLLVADDALGLIGRTPLVRLRHVLPGDQLRLWAKVELRNPGGSVKDRPALQMILAAEEAGRLGPGATIVEATSGNTGISLAMISAVRGYRCVLVMPEDMSIERRYIMRTYGAEIELTPSQAGMAGAVRRVEEIASKLPGAFTPRQFDNPSNPLAHELTTGREILEQSAGKVDVFVAGVGTGGTLTGVGRVLREALGSAVRIVAVEPARSAVLSGGQPGLHGIPGLGAGFEPPVLDRTLLDQIVAVSDLAAERMAQRLAREEGLVVGPSAAANVHVALEVAQSLGSGDIVTVLCDGGERYLF